MPPEFARAAASGLGQEPADIVQELRRRDGDAIDRAQHLVRADRAHVDADLGGILQVLRIALHRHERALQRFAASRRQIRRSSKRPRQRVGELRKLDQRARRVVLGQLTRSRHVQKVRMPGRARELDEHAKTAVGLEPLGFDRFHRG